jgi:2-polyprenyl-3-methyl-5-hydroxy-6-metoxy-1,4-benzoquinol methylase
MAEPTVDPGYYENERPEIVPLVPSSAKTILDVGCGKGRLGASLKREVHERKVYGIEYHPSIAREAERILDGVLVGDLQNMTITFPTEFFDCMIFADVLEHLVDPAAVLHKLKPHLKKEGIILCSIPNIRHYTAILRIIKGWQYDEYGLFDRTHLRFFTLTTMIQLLRDAGFAVDDYKQKIVASKKMILLNALCFHCLDDRLAMQYLLRAKLVP